MSGRALPRLGLTLASLGLALSLSCAPARPIRRAAHDAEWERLDQLLSEKIAQGKLRFPLVRSGARGLLEGEIARAEGLSGAQRILGLSRCADQLEDVLEDRSLRRDPAGGAARLLWTEAATSSAEPDETEFDLSERHYRAAFVRRLADPSKRRPYLRDVEPLVRRAALDAALDHHHSSDLSEILEISRQDPDDLCRSKALRWLGQERDPQALSALFDRFQAGNEKQRLFALGGLALRATNDLESRTELYHIALTDAGRVGLEAGFLFIGLSELPRREGRSTLDPPSLEQQKARVDLRLVGYAQNGARDERMSAISRLHKTTPEWIALLRSNTDPLFGQLSVVAWAELLDFDETRRSAELNLFEYATRDDALGQTARRSLARRGYSSLVPRLERDRNHLDPKVRREAALNLLDLGRVESVAPLLADPDAELRTELACELLAQTNR